MLAFLVLVVTISRDKSVPRLIEHIKETLMERNVGCIILDEPTIHLDRTRVHELSNLLGKMEMVPQSIIVTHEEALEGIADTIIKVRKENGESMIT